MRLQARPSRTLQTGSLTLHTTGQWGFVAPLPYNMELTPYSQEASSHAASLLASLNLQRERAQFCDCVVRQRQNPGQLHPAHRCVLAASSPVLASILSSVGALVELQAPCLSDAVLALLLDYIYTGALPSARSQHQYYNLLAAASYLQMDELQEALRAWQHTEAKSADDTNAATGAENQPYEDINYTKTVNNPRKYLALSLKRKDHKYSADAETCDDIDPRRTSLNNGANHCGRNHASNVSTAVSVNTGTCRQVIHLIQNVPRTTEEVQKDRFHSAGTVEELEKTSEDRRSSNLLRTAEVQEEETSREEKQQRLCLTVAEERQTIRKEEDKTPIRHSPLLHLSTSHLKDNVLPSQCAPSSSSSSPCCGAVPVICHSSRAAMLQLAEVLPMPPPYHPVSQASVISSRAPDSRSGSTASDSLAEGFTTRHKSNCGKQSQNYRNHKDHVGTQSWDYKDGSDQSDILKQDYNSSNADHLIGQKDEHMSNGLSHITDHSDRHAHWDSFKNKKQGLQHKSDLSFDDLPSKHQRLDCSDCHNVWMATAKEEQSIRSQAPKASDTGSDLRSEDLCCEVEAKEEHGYSRCPAETDRQNSHCNHYGPKTDGNPNLHRAETSTKDADSSQNEHNNRDTAMTDKTRRVDVCRPVSTTPESCLDSVTAGLSGFERCTSVELEKMSGIEIIEPHLTFTMPVDHNLSDPTYSVMGPSYRGHLQYHCLPQEETHLSHGYSGRTHSHPSHAAHSDQASDEEDVAVTPGYSPLRQHFATGTTDQVLLLDISAKPAELLVAKAFGPKETFGNLAISVAGASNKYCIGNDRSRPGAKVKHEAGIVEAVSNTKEGENHTTTMTVRSYPSVPDSVQASMSSTLSFCIPSTLSASMPTNISAHLSNPVHHPFHCSLCDRSFSQRGSLNRHVRSHLGVRPFPCPHCPMTFSRQYRVTEHMRVHQRCVLGSDFQRPPASSV